jgi:tape measure domain-containing protein
VAFTSLLGSSKAATDQIQALQKFAAATPFSQADVFGYAQQYFALADSVGLAKDQVQPFLTAIGDVASVTGASTEAIRNSVMAIGQIGSSGKVTLENLNQISEAFPGFNAAAAIGAATGQKTADVLDQISKGTLDAKTGVQALIVGMQKFPGAAGAMAKQAETLNGLFSTFKDTISITLTQAFQPLIPVVKDTLGKLTPIIGSALQALAPVIAEFVQGIAPVIGPLVTALGAGLGAVLQALEPLFAALTPVIKPLTDAFVAVVQAVAPLIAFLGQVISTLGPPLLAIFTQLVQAMQPVIKAFVEALAPILPKIADAMKAFGKALAPVAEKLAGVLLDAIKQVAPMLPDLVKLFSALADAALKIGSALIGALGKVLPVIIDAFKQMLPPLTEAATILGQAFADAINQLAPVLPDLAKAFVEIAVAMVDLLPPLARLVSSLLPPLVGLMKAFAPVLETVAHAITGLVIGLGKVIDFIQRLIDGAKEALDLLNQLGGDAPRIGVIWPGLDQAAGAAHRLAGELIAVGGGLQNLPTAGLDAVSAGIDTAATKAFGLLSVFQMVTDALDQLNHSQDPAHKPKPVNPITIGGGGGGGGGTTSTPTPPAKKPPFDRGLLSSLFQTATNTQTNPLVAALNSIFKSANAAGKSLGATLTKTLRTENTRLIALTKQRDKVADQLAKAQDKLAAARDTYNSEISSVRSTVRGTFDITSQRSIFNDRAVTVGDILANIKKAVANATAFTGILKKLAKNGLAQGLLQQLAEAGPSALPQAQALLASTPGQIKDLNSQYKALGTQGTNLGKFIADDLYSAGVQSAQGLVNGLRSQESALVSAVRALAEKMVKQIKTSLGIHSPSKVMHGLGINTAEGFRQGIASLHKDVAREADRLANSALPAGKFGSYGGSAAGGRGGHTFNVSTQDPRAAAEMTLRRLQWANA